MQPQTFRDLMVKAGAKASSLPAPESYLWTAVWWHLHSKESLSPEECIGYAKGQLRLAKDMAARPLHYRSKPADKTDWQWSGLQRETPSPSQGEAVQP